MKTEIMLHLKAIDEKIKELYEQRTQIIKETLNGENHISGVLHLDHLEKPFMRVTCTDNLNVFNSFDSVHRVSTIHRYEVKIEFLKNEPKEK